MIVAGIDVSKDKLQVHVEASSSDESEALARLVHAEAHAARIERSARIGRASKAFGNGSASEA